MIVRLSRTAAIVVGLFIAAGAARGEDAAPVETRWYGWQIMLSDAAGIALVAEGAVHNSGPLLALGVVTLAGVPALLHLAHHAPGDALTSVLVRAVPFGSSIAVFYLINPDCGDGCGELALPLIGLILSGAGAVVDWLYLSTERLEPRISFAPIVPVDRRRGAGGALTMRF
jgi:hypothetical protein